jgi:hypothetical protein
MAGFIHTHFFKGATGAALTALPSADSEIQPYLGSMKARLLTAQANVSATTLATIAEVSISQESSYANVQFKITQQNDAQIATGEASEQPHCVLNKIVARDMDLSCTPGGPGSDTCAEAIHADYGGAPGVPEGKSIDYLVTGTGDDSTTFTAFAGGTISDLDPQKMYGLRGLTPIIQDQAGIGIRCDCPSFNGLRPGMLFAGGGIPSYWKSPRFGTPVLAGIFSGAETLTLESASHVAQTPDCIVHLVEIGNIEAAPMGGVTQGGNGKKVKDRRVADTGNAFGRIIGGLTGGMARARFR